MDGADKPARGEATGICRAAMLATLPAGGKSEALPRGWVRPPGGGFVAVAGAGTGHKGPLIGSGGGD